jgi:hypothetical protein
MAGIEVGEDMPVVVVNIVHGHLQSVTGFVRILFHDEAVVLVKDRLTEFAAVRLRDFYGPGFHGWKLAASRPPLRKQQSDRLGLVASAKDSPMQRRESGTSLFGIAVRGFALRFGLGQELCLSFGRNLCVMTEHFFVPPSTARERTQHRAVVMQLFLRNVRVNDLKMAIAVDAENLPAPR